MEQGLHQGCGLAPLLFNIFFAAAINVAQTHHKRFGATQGIKGAGGWKEATAGKPALATSLWGMLYTDDTEVVSHSPDHPRKMMAVIVVVCAAFGLTVSEAKTDIMCLCTQGMPESTAIFTVGQVDNQTNELVYLGGNVPQCRPVHRRRRPAHTPRMMQLPEVHPRTVRPTERSPRAQNPDAKSRGTRDNTVRLRHVEPARVPLRHAAPSPPQLPDSLHRLAKEQSRRPLDFLSGHAYQDGK